VEFRDFFRESLLSRETGNLKLVQRALNHRSIKSTLRYARPIEAIDQGQYPAAPAVRREAEVDWGR
jgi:hypothetical protein